MRREICCPDLAGRQVKRRTAQTRTRRETMSTMTAVNQSLGAETFPADHRRARLHGRVAFVTGGTRGIGAAISRSFAEQGAVVAAGYGRDAERAGELLDQLRGHGVDASVHKGNVGSAEDCRRTIDEVIEAHGKLDIL